MADPGEARIQFKGELSQTPGRPRRPHERAPAASLRIRPLCRPFDLEHAPRRRGRTVDPKARRDLDKPQRLQPRLDDAVHGTRQGERARRQASSLGGTSGSVRFSKSMPNISKFWAFFSKHFQKSFGRFVGNQRLARPPRTLSLCSKFLAPIFVPRPAPRAVGKTVRAQGDKKKRSMIFGFQKRIVGVGKRRRFPRRSAAFPSTGSRTRRIPSLFAWRSGAREEFEVKDAP